MDRTPRLTDTTDEARAIQDRCIREMAPRERLDLAISLTMQVRKMAMDAIRKRHPDLNDDQLRLRFIELVYGPALAEQIPIRLSETGS